MASYLPRVNNGIAKARCEIYIYIYKIYIYIYIYIYSESVLKSSYVYDKFLYLFRGTNPQFFFVFFRIKSRCYIPPYFFLKKVPRNFLRKFLPKKTLTSCFTKKWEIICLRLFLKGNLICCQLLLTVLLS